MQRTFGWRGIALTVEGPLDLLDAVQQQLPPFYDQAGDVVAEGWLREDGDLLVLELPDDLSLTTPRSEEARRAVASRLELLLCERLPDRVAVHAGVVAIDGRAIVVPGTSMAGKSTLVQALVASGATYFSDEFALLDADGLVWPYPRPMTLRNPYGRERSIPQPAAHPAGPPAEVALLAALTWSHDGWDANPITAGEAVLDLLANCAPVRREPARTLDCLSAAVREATAIKGPRGEAGEASMRLRETLAAPTTTRGHHS